MKHGPLSEDIVAGTPKCNIISCINILVTSRDLAVLVGNASSQPEKVSLNTNRYLYPPLIFQNFQEICHCCPGALPFPIEPISNLGVFLGLVWRQRSHC